MLGLTRQLGVQRFGNGMSYHGEVQRGEDHASDGDPDEEQFHELQGGFYQVVWSAHR